MESKSDNIKVVDSTEDLPENCNATEGESPIAGKPKSGRVWKRERERNERHSAFTKDKPCKTSWDKKMQQKAALKNVKLYEKELKGVIAKEVQDKRERTKLNRKTKEENQRKAEIVQPVKNAAKLKRLKKKQLRKAPK